MKKMHETIQLSPKDQNAIEETIRLLRDRFPVLQIVLYGSKSTGTDDEESDIDLLLLTERVLSWREQDAVTEALYDVELRHDVVISTLVISHEQWINGPYTCLPIYGEIQREGVELWTKSTRKK
ncbi:MAG: nucleotidyltransferase domain-containing protein [Candidatus Omnitrophota bacterium]|jgi:predicted nucleotidyltransferase|nr:MAG: nucleotidyltransferase domain-containing protein [Candidatus Omnitrophota bacterium]